MCDSLVALPHMTQPGYALLAKNSDREPDEAQALAHFPRQYPTETHVRCTFREIPQVRETYEVIVSKPFQMWGAEMGVNEWGVAIANEAVFTQAPLPKKNEGLTGMDLLRLALERAKTAQEARQVILTLLETYGQDACGGYRNKNFFYHNSFLIADPNEAFVVDTAAKAWAWKSVKHHQSISNALNITTDYEACRMTEKASWGGFFPKKSSADFQRHYSDIFYTTFSRAKKRRVTSSQILAKNERTLDPAKLMQALQSHHLPDPQFTPQKAHTGDLCMHATGLTNPNSTTGSMVAALRAHQPSTIWLTGTPHPCLSLFIPFFHGTRVIDSSLQPGAHPDASLWWKAFEAQQRVLQDYPTQKKTWRAEQQEIQASFIQKEQELFAQEAVTHQALQAFSQECLRLVQDWYTEKGSKMR